MNGRFALAYALVAATLVCLLSNLNTTAQSQDNTPQVPQYEFTVRQFRASWGDNELGTRYTQEMNSLAKVGWEYVGPIAEHSLTRDASRTSTTTYVAFRRPLANQR